MNRMVLEIARWEFLRFFKIKEQIVTFVIMFLFGFGAYGAARLVDRIKGQKAKVAVVNPEVLPFEVRPEGRVEIVPADRPEADLAEAVGRKEIDGLLVFESDDRARLLVAGLPAWVDDLSTALTAARQARRLQQARLSPDELSSMLVPFEVDVAYHPAGTKPSSTAERIAAGIFVVLVVFGVFLGLAYLFTGITGEKQLRVTEQVISAVSPQTWIDGKILGISALALTLVAVYGLNTLLMMVMLRAFGAGISIPVATLNPILVTTCLVLALLGFLFWFAFFAAIAATIDDPNNSARSVFLFLPILAYSVALAALRAPDAPAVRFLGMFPLTSPSVLPARLVLGNVALWEVGVAILLLIASIWALRRVAGKIFELGILMFGKEPTWREIWYWIRRTS